MAMGPHSLRTFRLLIVAVTCVVALVALCVTPAMGLVMDMSTTGLTDASATVVVAKAVSCESHWTNPAGASLSTKGTIVTDVRLAVYEVLKGDARPAMTITVPGGTVGAVSVPIADAPRFAVGSMYVVFLDANDSVVAWHVGQPQIVGGQVPALHASLSQLKASLAQRTGRSAEVLRPWSGRAPMEPVADPYPAEVASQNGSSGATRPSQLRMGTGSFALPAGTILDRTPAEGSPGTAPRAVTTLLADDFSSGMSNWNILYGTPVHANQGRWNYDYWLTDNDDLFEWAYSAGAYAWWSGAGWMWDHQFAFGAQYANNDVTWMIAGPFNLSSSAYGTLEFDTWVDTAGPGDYVGAWFSTDGNNFSGPTWSGQEGSFADPPKFASKAIDLRNVPVPGGTQNFCNRSQVWIAFYFQSDGSGADRGVCVDNVNLRAGTTPIPVISSINPPSAPSGTYLQPTRNQSRITISGSGFGANEGDVAFYYQDGEPLIAGIVRTWSDTQITCDVPIGTINNYPGSAGTGPVKVRTAGGTWSGGYSFEVPWAYGAQNWEASRCLYRVNMDGSQQAAVDAATQSWNNVGTQMQFQDIGACTTTPVGSGDNTHMPVDGHNDMCFDSLPWTGVIAAAFPIAVGGRILETDICFNTTGGFSWGDAWANSSLMDIETIAAHETGHWLNLRDLYGPGDTARVMYGFCGTGVVKRALTAGEVAGIQWIYADHGTDTVGPVGRARSLTVIRGRTAKVKYNVDDPKPSIGVSTCKVQIKNRSGHVVKTKNAVVYTRMWNTWSFRCRLAKGRYSIVVTGTDLLGQASTRSVKGYLTVK